MYGRASLHADTPQGHNGRHSKLNVAESETVAQVRLVGLVRGCHEGDCGGQHDGETGAEIADGEGYDEHGGGRVQGASLRDDGGHERVSSDGNKGDDKDCCEVQPDPFRFSLFREEVSCRVVYVASVYFH